MGRSTYLSISCSLFSSSFCRAITELMMLLSSSVRWLRSGEVASRGAGHWFAIIPGPPRETGPFLSDILRCAPATAAQSVWKTMDRGSQPRILHRTLWKCRIGVLRTSDDEAGDKRNKSSVVATMLWRQFNNTFLSSLLLYCEKYVCCALYALLLVLVVVVASGGASCK